MASPWLTCSFSRHRSAIPVLTELLRSYSVFDQQRYTWREEDRYRVLHRNQPTWHVLADTKLRIGLGRAYRHNYAMYGQLARRLRQLVRPGARLLSLECRGWKGCWACIRGFPLAALLVELLAGDGVWHSSRVLYPCGWVLLFLCPSILVCFHRVWSRAAITVPVSLKEV